MGKRLNIAVVGCGVMARQTHLPNIVRNPGINLRWCCDTDPDMLSLAKSEFHPERSAPDIAEIASDPECDAVLLATHPAGRLELISGLAAAGKHIYAEKPLADNIEDMLQIQKIVRDSGIVLTVGHNRRMAPAILKAKSILEKHRANPSSEPWRWDRIGPGRKKIEQEEQTCILMRVNDDYFSWKEWCFADEVGILLVELNHFTDLAHYFTSTEPVSVSAMGDAKMNVVVNIQFECGSLCTIFDACVGSFAYPKELYEIYSHGAVIAVDHCMEVRTAGIPGEPFRQMYPSASDPTSSGIESWYMRTVEAMRVHKSPDKPIAHPSPEKGHYEILNRFARACLHGEKNPCDAVAGSRSAAVVIKAAESLTQNGAALKITEDDYISG